MRINKDSIIGGIVALLLVAIIAWGYTTTVQLKKVVTAHDNLVRILMPVINQLTAQKPQPVKQPVAEVVPAVTAPKDKAGK